MNILRLRHHVLALILPIVLFNPAGCSIYSAVTQPPKKNLEVLNAGTPRSVVLAELGEPVTSKTTDGKTVDVFRFMQGYSTATKGSRAVFHTAADVFSLGLWEAVGTPIENAYDGSPMAYEVTYNESEQVEKVVILRR